MTITVSKFESSPPPNFVGTQRLRSPTSNAFSKISRGNFADRSYSGACGITSFFTKSRAKSRRAFCSSESSKLIIQFYLSFIELGLFAQDKNVNNPEAKPRGSPCSEYKTLVWTSISQSLIQFCFQEPFSNLLKTYSNQYQSADAG